MYRTAEMQPRVANSQIEIGTFQRLPEHPNFAEIDPAKSVVAELKETSATTNLTPSSSKHSLPGLHGIVMLYRVPKARSRLRGGGHRIVTVSRRSRYARAQLSG